MKHTLLAVCGLSPQVITEALYALWHQGRPISRLEIITTRQGKEKILSELFAPKDGRLDAFLGEFGIDRASIDFGPHLLQVITDSRGGERDDIITPDDNESLLRVCLHAACRLTSDPSSALFFLVAGGRKTMTSCLTLAAQLYGRPQDRIYHVLVTPEFEQSRDFWYPPRIPRLVTLRDGLGREFSMDTRYAAVELISIPFVSVRDRLSSSLLSAPRPPAELLAAIIRDPPDGLRVQVPHGKLAYSGLELDLFPAHIALYAFFAEQKKRCRLPGPCQGCDGCFLDISTIMASQEDITQHYRQTSPGKLDAMSDTGILALNQANFNSYRSKINRALVQAYGQGPAAALIIDSVGRRPNTRYGIRLERGRICLEW